ncbi:signal transduction histidine kinase [Amycolatopsis echigonensis]|uniref:histidine kinase n=1 Tax=Amycolatopsis echigonensis TaxID=2576905 RepID=A0A2N3WME4_9PSEU|nr:sensor domain-containing protein [Amycolatopsis niigatensis]PKV95033.1 signal transduction histidine kinase [Amycolatopsis niigatensis]
MPVTRPPTMRTIGFLVLSLPIRLAAFVLILVTMLVGVATTMLWIGIPVLLVATSLMYSYCTFERRWAHRMLGVTIAEPVRRRPVGPGMLAVWQARLLDTATWREFAFVLIAFPLGIVEFVAGVVSTAVPPFGIFVAPRIGTMHGELATSFLGPNRTAQLEARTQQLRNSRARGVDAVEAERRRIERDLHDGAQQRLVSVAMSLGRAQLKLDLDDPTAVRELIGAAHADAKLAVSELRDLARGIYPPVLQDRGLDAALSSLTARMPIPIEVEVTVEPRPPAPVETTTYFIVSETLTNVTKHSGADRASVRVTRDDDTVVVEITDNGHGGASMRPGGGLAGLADRAATIDGVLTVVSPVGGPTVVRADLPVRW